MRDVAIIGIGQTPVQEHWPISLRHLALEAALNALQDARIEKVDAIYVGNMLSGEITGQEHLGALLADELGQSGAEALKVEAACASGAAALRVGMMAVASGMNDLVLVTGVEKMTDTSGRETTAALAMAADAEFEVAQGVSFVSLNALLMRRYMYEYGWERKDFANFVVTAHANGMKNPNAMFHMKVTPEQYAHCATIADPVGLLDASPVCDGAAAVVLAPAEYARTLSPAPIRIRGSGIATAPIAVHDRKDPLALEAARLSVKRAYEMAKVKPQDISFFELHDAFTIMSALSLEAAGFAERGQGVRLALDGEITLEGRIPIATMGGLKSRGHPVGATGMYQIVEAVLQLRGLAGKNQLRHPRLGMTQNIGGSGATIITTILEAMG
ncbi:MAG TPA: thiolase domain-containing protein [Anaerolineae bacterium]|nr:thiolase domain-containing protein [Anaerolineae bacterium]HXK42059.1 thiolase domain-containing protein [Anaerolineae bacterium]